MEQQRPESRIVRYQRLYQRKYHEVLAMMTPNMPGGLYSGSQLAYARSLARGRAIKELGA